MFIEILQFFFILVCCSVLLYMYSSILNNCNAIIIVIFRWYVVVYSTSRFRPFPGSDGRFIRRRARKAGRRRDRCWQLPVRYRLRQGFVYCLIPFVVPSKQCPLFTPRILPQVMAGWVGETTPFPSATCSSRFTSTRWGTSAQSTSIPTTISARTYRWANNIEAVMLA